MNQHRMPSPTILVAVVALVAALAGTAVAGPNATTSAINKKKVKKIATKQAQAYFDANIGAASVANAETATNADNAASLGGKAPSGFETASASDVRTDPVTLTDGVPGDTVLTTTITVRSRRTVTANASVEGVGSDDVPKSMGCSLKIAGTEGPFQATGVFDSPSATQVTLPLTFSRTVNPGTHTVSVTCLAVGDVGVGVDDRSLTAVATG